MKKLFAAVLAMTLLASVAGCSDDKEPAESSKTTSQVTDSATTSANAEEETATAEKTPVKEKPLSVFSEHYMYGQCSVALMYPRYGDGGHDAFDLSMRNYAVQMVGKNGMLPEDSAIYEITDCNIMLETEHFVSAVVEGQIINPASAHDSHFAYTVNADIKTGKIYLSEELIGDVELIKTAIAENKFTQSFGMDGVLDTVTPEVITGSWRSDYGVFPSMYFTKDSFGVMAELPHAVGGYVGLELPWADVGEMVNPVAKGLAGKIVTTD